jgi:hypothetical protein
LTVECPVRLCGKSIKICKTKTSLGHDDDPYKYLHRHLQQEKAKEEKAAKKGKAELAGITVNNAGTVTHQKTGTPDKAGTVAAKKPETHTEALAIFLADREAKKKKKELERRTCSLCSTVLSSAQKKNGHEKKCENPGLLAKTRRDKLERKKNDMNA